MSLAFDFPQTAVGLPSSLKYELPPSLPDSARAYNVAVSPNGITQVTGTALPASLFTSAGSMPSTNFNSQILAFDIPCGQGHVFLDPKETMLNFRLTWTVTGASSATAPALNLIGSAASFFDALTIYHNNTPVEIVQNYNLLHNLLMNSSVNSSERYGGISVGCGADTNTMTGIDLPHAATNISYFNFCIPLCSIIGLNCDKLIPVGYLQNLQLQLQTANILPVASYCTAVATQPVISAPVLDQFTLNMKYIDVGDVAANLLSQTLQDGKWFIKASTYTNSNITVPMGSNGTSSLLFQIRNSSVKSLFIQHGIAASAACPNGYYDAINPALTSLQCSVAGVKYPNKPLNPSQRPAECFAALMSAWGASSLKSFGGTMYRGNYGATIPSRPTTSDNTMVTPVGGLRPVSFSDATNDIVVSYPNMHYQGFDLERVSGSLFSGVNTRSAPPYIDVTFGAASTSTIQSYAWGLSDVVLVIDTTTKHLQAYI